MTAAESDSSSTADPTLCATARHELETAGPSTRPRPTNDWYMARYLTRCSADE